MGHAARALGDRHGRMRTVLLARGVCLSWPIGLPSAAPFEPLAGSGDATSAFTVRMENYTASTYPGPKLGGYLAARYLAARYLLSRAEDGVASRAHGQVDLLMMEPRTTREEPMVSICWTSEAQTLASRSAKGNQCTAQCASRLDQSLTVHRSTSILNQ